MKKVLLGLAALLVSANLFAGEFVIKGGLDLNQDTSVKFDGFSDSADSNSTFTLQGEYYGQINKNIFIGCGINLSSLLKIEDTDFVNLYPIYATAKYKLDKSSNVTPYFGAKIGAVIPSFDDNIKDGLEEELEYNLGSKFYGCSFDEKAGLLLGINGGVEFDNNFIVEVSFEHQNYSLDTSLDGYDDATITQKFKTNKIGINAGYKF